MEKGKPRSRICWFCGKKLRGNSYIERVVDHHPRILHGECAATLARDPDAEPKYAEETELEYSS